MKKTATPLSLVLVFSILCVFNPNIVASPLDVKDVKKDHKVDFGKEVYPFLKKNCLACHNTSKAKAGLNIETPQLMQSGGDSGPALIPGNSADSLMFTSAAHIDEDITMPPEKNKSKAKNLTPVQLGLLKAWIDQGAEGSPVIVAAPETWLPLTGKHPIHAAALSPDGRYAAAGRGHQIHLYDLHLGRLIDTLADPGLRDSGLIDGPIAHLDTVSSLAFSPNGDLVSGGFRVAKFWQLRQTQGQKEYQLNKPATSLASSKDGKWLAAGLEDGSILVQNFDPQSKPGLSPWHAIGPFIDRSHDRAYRNRFAPEKSVNLKATHKNLKWKEKPELIDGKLHQLSGENCATYLYRTIESPSQMPIHLSLKSNNSFKIWLNNKLLSERMSTRQSTQHQEKLTTLLKKGTNKLLIKIINASDAYRFQFDSTSAGKRVVEIKDHNSRINALVFTPDNQLISASKDKTLRIRSMDDPSKSSVIHTDKATKAFAYLPESKLVACSNDNNIRLYSLSAFKLASKDKTQTKPSLELNGHHDKPICSLQPDSSNGKQLVSASEDGMVHFWDLQKTKSFRTIKTHTSPISSMTITPDGKRMAIISGNTLELWDCEKKQKITTLQGAPNTLRRIEDLRRKIKTVANLRKLHENSIPTLTKDWKKSNEDALKTATDAVTKRHEFEQKNAELHSLRRTKPRPKKEDLAAAEERTASAKVKMSAADRVRERGVRVAAVSAEKLVEAKVNAESAKQSQVTWEKEIKALQSKAEKLNKERPLSISFSPDSSQMAVAMSDGSIKFWAASTGSFLKQTRASEDKFQAITFGNNETLYTVDKNKNLNAWPSITSWQHNGNLGDGKNSEIFPHRVTALSYDPSGSILATGSGSPSRKGSLRLWNAFYKTPIGIESKLHSDVVTGITFSPNGDQLASSSADTILKTYNTNGLQFIRNFEGHTSYALDVDWSTDGRHIASVGVDKAVRIWDVETGSQTDKQGNYNGPVTSVSYTGNGDKLLTSSGDGKVNFENKSLTRTKDSISIAAISNDGTRIIDGGKEGTLRVWDGKTRKLLFSFSAPDAMPNTRDSAAAMTSEDARK